MIPTYLTRLRYADRAEAGAASVVWLSMIVLCLMLGLVAFAISEFASTRARVAGAADLAALAAANNVLHPDACARAARTAMANGARLSVCRLAGTDVEITVEGRAGGALERLAQAAGKSPPPIVVNARAGQREAQ